MNLKKIYPWYFTSGALVLYLALCFMPSIIGIFYSFTDWNNFTEEIHFVGIDNYKTVFSGNQLYTSYIKNTMVFTLFTTFLKTIIGLAFALTFTNKRITFKNFHRMVIFSPQILSYLIVGLVFKSILHPSTGFLNIALKSVNLDVLAQNWLGSLEFAFPTLIAVDVWKGSGYIMVVLIAGIQAISRTYYEAAKIDGATYFQQLKGITIPLLIPALVNVTVLNLTYGFRVFDIVYALTNGGPGYATSVINTAVYKEFSKGNYAMGTTLSTLLFLFVMIISYFIIKGMEGKEVEA